jgi:hypothetical protein
LFGGDAWAYRPFDGTDAAVADTGEFELELGPAHLYRLGTKQYTLMPATVLNLGLVRDLELVVDVKNSFVRAPKLQLVDDDVFLKYVLRRGVLQGGKGISIAAEGGPLTPETGGTKVRFGGQLNFIFSYRLPIGAIHLNETGAYSRQHNIDLTSGAILEGPDAWVVRPVLEVFYENQFHVGSTYSGLIGALWRAREEFVVDAGVRGASIQGTGALELRLGFTWAIPIWDPRPPVVESAKLETRRHPI